MSTDALMPLWLDQVHQGDSLERLRAMPSQSVDLVITSPPYENARLYGKLRFKKKGAEWVEWALLRYFECLRVCRGLVAWVVEGKTDDYRWSATPALLMADLHRAGVCLRKPPAFYRFGIPGSGGADWFRNDYEFIVCATARRGKLPYSDNTACGHTPKWGPGGAMSNRLTDGSRVSVWGKNGRHRGMGNRRPDGTRETKPRPSGEVIVGPFGNQPSTVGRRPDGSGKRPYFNGARSMMRPPNGTKDGDLAGPRVVPFPVLANPGNVIRCNVGGNLMGSKLAHLNEAPFPEALVERFVLSCCPPGGVVLDPFSGSGTTAAVAILNGRHFVAIDQRADQCDLTRRRVAEAHERLKRRQEAQAREGDAA